MGVLTDTFVDRVIQSIRMVVGCRSGWLIAQRRSP